MKDTACKDCPFKTMGFSECPNYIETLWYQKDNPQPVIVKDCAPKRTLLMLQELHSRMFGMQQQINQQETECVNMRASINRLYDGIRNMEEHRKLEKENALRQSLQLHHMKNGTHSIEGK